MVYKDLAQQLKKKQKLVPGHRTCSGCAIPIIARHILASCDDPIVAGIATGCLEVTSTIYPFNAWNIPTIHNAFENVAATISGAERAWKSLDKKGKLTAEQKKIKFIAFAGDGGTYDIGLQSLSGAIERGHDFLYVCYDNGGYMNTGNQRSGATPFAAETSTTPCSSDIEFGKKEYRKNIAEIVAGHNIPYVAQASVGHLLDLTQKVKKALSIRGPKFMVVLSPCPFLWKFSTALTIQIAKLAVETKFWPLYEIENGKYKITYEPEAQKPVIDFLNTQGRFKKIIGNAKLTQEIQNHVNKDWENLQRKAKCTQ